MKPAWAENLAWDHIREILGDGAQHLFWQPQLTPNIPSHDLM